MTLLADLQRVTILCPFVKDLCPFVKDHRTFMGDVESATIHVLND